MSDFEKKEKPEEDEDRPYRDWDSNSEQLNALEVESNPTKDFMYFIYDLLKTGIVVFLIAFCLRYFAVQPFIVDGESMEPNFVNNEYLLAEKVSYIIGQPKRGDAIIFRYPGNPSVNYIKRIIGLPGETVKVENNKVIVYNNDNPNGMILDEGKYIPSSTQTLPPDGVSYERTLGSDEYFVLGDNREHSSDSREWGILPKANIIGRAWLTIVPLDRFGIQKRISYSTTPLSNVSVLFPAPKI